jgi:tRNA A-37 threonylcarbamoyl transferase component Bud32/predicted RNA-binding Zn ribbon-like protein
VACKHCGESHPPNVSRCPVTGREIGTPHPSAGLTIGQALDGKYKIIREIGRGAMGVVYEGLHIALDRRVAVKTLRHEMSNDADLATRFQREARAASAIGHPHIIDVFDLGRTPDGLLFMVMELLDGKPLTTLLQQTPLMPVPLAVNLMNQVLGGLAAAHKHGIVHRDLKPDNIFIIDTEDRPNFVKIVDFGIAKKLSPRQPGQVNAAMSGTMVGTVMGTPLYMSPEQAIGQVAEIDHRTDIYAAGVVLYEMLCGRTPFQGHGYAAILGAVLEGKFPPPRGLRPDIPPAIEAAIVRAIDRDIQKRFPSAAAMRDAINDGGAVARPAPIALGAAARDGLSLKLATLDGQEAAPGIALLADIPPPQASRPPAPGRPRVARGPGGDRFAPPPEQEAPLELGGTRWGSAAPPRAPARQTAEEPPRLEVRRPARGEDDGLHASAAALDDDVRYPALARPFDPTPPPPLAERPRAQPPTPGTLAPEHALPARTRRLLAKLAIGLGVLVAARVGYHFWQTSSLDHSATAPPPAVKGVMRKVTLVVDPPDTSVQIDHIPTAKRELTLDSGTPHLVNATAPGRLTRRFSFDAKPGLKLVVRMNHLLVPPSPLDPPPAPAELSLRYPESSRPSEEIDAALGKLDKYAQCLAAAGDSEGGDKASAGARARLHGEDLARCRTLVREARDQTPAIPALEAAADSYLSVVQAGQKLEAVTRASAALRAELLATRSEWQWQELALQEKLDGRKAAWHMRRFALGANAWLRAIKSDPPARQSVDEQASALNDAYSMFLEYAEGARPELARTAGSNDFMKAAQDTMAVARPSDGKPRSEFAALSACRRLVAAFNALVVE